MNILYYNLHYVTKNNSTNDASEFTLTPDYQVIKVIEKNRTWVVMKRTFINVIS